NTWDNLAITAIAYDPNNTQTFYVGTGEGWGAGASRGAGIWKSTDAGSTWTQLSSTSAFYYVNDLVVRDESGSSVVYAAVRGNSYRGQWHGISNTGLQRSINGGTSWTQVLPNAPGGSSPYAPADIEIAADDRLWVGTQENPFGDGGGRIMYSDNGTSWTVSRSVSGGERVELACAPSNSNYVYALTESQGQAHEIARTTNKGATWFVRNEPNDADNGIPSTDFTRGQAWYDLILAVDPNNQNTVIAGGIDLFRSTNGASSWTQISKWSNNNNLANLSCSLVHADQHQVVFKPGSSSTVLFGTDGGVYYTNSVATAGSSNVISGRNLDYNVTQFYAAALHPTAGSNYALAGSQDNGTQKFTNPGYGSTTEATGGDGAYCFIDQTNANYQITSYVYNNYWRSTNGGSSWGFRFQNDNSTGRFINPADYDDNQDILYSARTSSTVNRVTGISSSVSIGSISISGMSSMASHLRVSPYTTNSTTLFVGTENGNLFKVSNANSSPSTSNIGSSSFPTGRVSCVELGANENEILVTFSNYGVTSVWYSSNG
ncbi:MAG: WD40/YVTN/BNR-like repeat-containing protein, partial [Croceimicrobium sp.]